MFHRKMLKHEFWKERRVFSRAEAWIWMLCEARWKPEVMFVASVPVHCERGEFAYSLRYLARAWGWSLGRVVRFLEALKVGTQIDTETDHERIRIRITNYERYQSDKPECGTETDTETDTEASTEADTKTKKKKTRNKKQPPAGELFEKGLAQ